MTRAAALNKGDSATFKGRVQGFVVGSVSIRDAELERRSRDVRRREGVRIRIDCARPMRV